MALALPVAWIALRVAAFPARDFQWVSCCSLGGALLSAVASVTAWESYDPSGPTYWRDDQVYWAKAGAIAAAWRTGWFPVLEMAGSSASPYVGSLNTGYERMLAAAFWLAGGPSLAAGRALNIAAVAILPWVAFILADGLAPVAAPSASASAATATIARDDRRNFDPRRLAALMVAVHPAFPYWSGILMRDAILACLAALAVATALDTMATRRPAPALAFVGALVWLTAFRNYAGLAVALGFGVRALAGVPARAALWCAGGAGAAAWVAGYSSKGDHYVTQVLFSVFGTQSHPELSTIPAVFKHLVMAFPRMALAPFAWVTAEGPAPLYGLYPGMWFLYLVVYPLGLAGVAEAVARDRRQAAVPLVAAMASCGVFLAVYGGDATRQRLFLEVILMPFAAFGWSARRRGAWAVAWFATLILFAAAQSARLAMRQP